MISKHLFVLLACLFVVMIGPGITMPVLPFYVERLAATYFDQDCEDERETRTLADAPYRRANWQWARNGGATITHGWKPEGGFLTYRTEGYDEVLLVYVLGLGSPTYPLPKESYSAWTSTYEWKEMYGHEFLYCSSRALA